MEIENLLSDGAYAVSVSDGIWWIKFKRYSPYYCTVWGFVALSFYRFKSCIRAV
ncbi:hypothetical protein ACVWQR_10305 [Neisseria meningitidis]